MLTLQDIINEIAKIRDVTDQIEVRGKQNAAYLCYVYDKCSALIDELEKTALQIQNDNKAETIEAGEENGEQHTESAG